MRTWWSASPTTTASTSRSGACSPARRTGLADPGEAFAATAGVAPGDPDGWFDAVTDLGARLEADAAAWLHVDTT